MIDADDWDWISAHSWNYGWHAKTKWKFYAKRNVGPGRATVYLHREILLRHQPVDDPGAWHAHHINGQSLDNRKSNLQWLPPAANSAIRLRRHDIPTLEAIMASLVPEYPALETVPF